MGSILKREQVKKNIQYPYSSYSGHFCLGIIYDRVGGASIDETKTHTVDELHSITSVVGNFNFFVVEKWKIASDKGGSGNTANIGSIKNIADIVAGRGMFSKLGESWFDDYWMNFKKITVTNGTGRTNKIDNLIKFVEYRGGDIQEIVKMNNENSTDND